ncbi:MAG TPA: hypothetical protein VGE74_18750 [Gemmata sp.]
MVLSFPAGGVWVPAGSRPAQFVRLEVRLTSPETTQTERYGLPARLEDLRPALDPNWFAICARPRIANCDAVFAFRCPPKWQHLAGTGDPNVRRCGTCDKDVCYCGSLGEARGHAELGRCVAVAIGVDRFPGAPGGSGPAFIGRARGAVRMPAPPTEPLKRPRWKFW